MKYTVNIYGEYHPEPDTTGMMFPVQCTHCGGVYDVGCVTVTARYADCSVWTTPCCKRVGVDDRPSWSTGEPRHYRKLGRW
jgi:hypothetical protein